MTARCASKTLSSKHDGRKVARVWSAQLCLPATSLGVSAPLPPPARLDLLGHMLKWQSSLRDSMDLLQRLFLFYPTQSSQIYS